MRAISSFNFDAGISPRECLAETAFRIRANMSAIGSVIRYNSIFDCRLPIADLINQERQSQIDTISTSSISRRLGSDPPAPVHESKFGTSETCAGMRADGRIGGNAYTRATKTSACD